MIKRSELASPLVAMRPKKSCPSHNVTIGGANLQVYTNCRSSRIDDPLKLHLVGRGRFALHELHELQWGCTPEEQEIIHAVHKSQYLQENVDCEIYSNFSKQTETLYSHFVV